MLKIQEFILAHENWRELLTAAPYNLKISEDDGFVLFKYNQISSDFNEEICKEARGLILDSQDNFKVVRFAFEKFFNLGEVYADEIDWSSSISSEKVDGSIMTLWYARGKWRLSTNSTIDAYKAKIGNDACPYKTFGDLFSAAARDWTHCTLIEFDKDYNYTFELVSPWTTIVIPYPEPALYHIGTRRMTDLKEVDVNIGVQKPKVYILNDEKDYQDLVSSFDDTHEGIVVRDKFYNRVKIKTPLYFQLHKMANNGNITLERAIDIIKANEQSEFLAYFPQYEDFFKEVEERLNQIDRLIDAVEYIAFFSRTELEKKYSEKQARKEFAQIYSNFIIKHAYFAAYEGKLRSKVNKMSTSQFIKFWKPLLEDI